MFKNLLLSAVAVSCIWSSATFANVSVAAMPYETLTLPEYNAKVDANPADNYQIVILGASWCGWCTKLGQWLDEVADLTQVAAFKVDNDNSPEVRQSFNASYPTWLVYKGNQVISKVDGAWGGEEFGREAAGIKARLVHLGVPVK